MADILSSSKTSCQHVILNTSKATHLLHPSLQQPLPSHPSPHTQLQLPPQPSPQPLRPSTQQCAPAAAQQSEPQTSSPIKHPQQQPQFALPDVSLRSYSAAAVGAATDDELCQLVGKLHTADTSSAANAGGDIQSGFVATEAELQAALEQSCAVCLELVRPKKRFGIMTNCNHCVCIECIREWRTSHAVQPEVARSCPECRVLSHFIVPSAIFITESRRKEELVRGYLDKLRSQPCRHFAFGAGTCPFGNSCFYAHVDERGNHSRGLPRRMLSSSGESRAVVQYKLADYLFSSNSLAQIPLGPE
eukprot:CAMPEP_0119305480 /NCGR_PEP_ID=MMETSP1333-20130426/6478_1 /TAXON_ID=418940 /ORGANISM="Scyphosphaera apsteinii, Strain RCC1455" /LENGTH=303 /DNA_ID=CAMNT_0007308579 /DNA_START=189 /DNA_END=1099 /DNA_ORIENTATION=-